MDENQNMSPVPNPEMPVLPTDTVLEKKTSWIKITAVTVSIILLAIVGAGAIFYYTYASPAKVWSRFLSSNNPSDLIATEDFNFSYKDNGKLGQSDLDKQPFMAMFSKLRFAMGGNAYIDASNRENMDLQGKFNYTFASGSTSFSAGLELIMKGQDMYMKVGDVPFIGGALTELNDGKSVDWIKMNFQEMAEASKDSSETLPTAEDFKNNVKKFNEIGLKYANKIITYDKVLGHEKIHGVYTVHFSNQLNKTELKAMVKEIVDYVATLPNQTDKEMTEEEKAKAVDLVVTFFNSIVDRMQVNTFETWVGITDARLYRIKFETTAPSLVSAIAAGEAVDKENPDETDDKKIMEAVLAKLSYDGVFSFDEDIYDYGKKQNVTAPADAMDLAKKIKEQADKEKEIMNEFEPNQGTTKKLQ